MVVQVGSLRQENHKFKTSLGGSGGGGSLKKQKKEKEEARKREKKIIPESRISPRHFGTGGFVNEVASRDVQPHCPGVDFLP